MTSRDLKGGKANNTGSPYDGEDMLLKFKEEKKNVVKDSSSKTPTHQSKHRVELQTLYLNQNSQDLIMETLRHIHGPEFKLKDHSLYRDQGSNLKDQYWVNRGNLVVQGGIDYSTRTPRSENDIINSFAVSKLEGYGFHTSHCTEALTVAGGNVGKAMEILENEYFKLGMNPLPTNTDNEESGTKTISSEELDELLAERNDEKMSLKSIYEDQFEERIANKLWVFNLELNYLLEHYNPQPKHEDWDDDQKRKTKPKQVCKYYLKGQCKFTLKCRYSHHVPTPNKPEPVEKHTFQLEVRFGDNCTYPREIPFLFLTTQAPKFPSEASLRLTFRIIQEAQSHAENGGCFIFALVQFLMDNPSEMLTCLYGSFDNELFLNPKQPLFPPPEDESELLYEFEVNSSRYASSKRQPRSQVSIEALLREDAAIIKKCKEKQNSLLYKKFLKSRNCLPGFIHADKIKDAVENNQVVVICGDTGCGKSTQVPQHFFDEWIKSSPLEKHLEIVCTQPRRISAIGVAERVAEERAERVGNTVGYQIRLESKTSSSTRLLFCTTGILLRRLESDPTLANVSHIVVDEVHERSEESDFLLLILKELLLQRPDLKVILMSATLNSELFSNYFSQAPIIQIEGKTFDVKEYFLEDTLEVVDYAMEENSKYTRTIKKGQGEQQIWEIELATADLQLFNEQSFIRNKDTKDENLTLLQLMSRYQGYSKQTVKNLYLMDPEKIDYDLIERVLVWMVSGSHEHPKTGSILVFLPGIGEISSLLEQLSVNPLFSPKYGRFLLLPLHSSLSSEDQSAVFRKPKEGVRKIVISTNIAETSITIDDCVFVIDTGKMKEKRFDGNKNMESLDMVWVSRANATQRKGRAGRVMPGVCVHLYTLHRYSCNFLSQPVPELHRVPLEQLLLRIKTMPNFADQNPHGVLERTLEPPASENIDSALERLKDVGALDKKYQLTPLGRHLAALPVDVRVGKLMLFGAIFCCIDSALTIAACLSYKSPFLSPYDKKDQADKKKKEFALANSDQMTTLKVYQTWLRAMARSTSAGYNFARENFLSQRTLVTLADIKHQFLELLLSIGFVNVDIGRRRSGQDRVLEVSGASLNANGDNPKLLSAILCAALYPNVVKVLTPEKSFAVGVAGALPKEFKPEELKFKSRDDSLVFIHPSSVNYTVNYYTSPYLVYQEKVKTSRVFIRDISMVPMLPLLLFSGCGLKVELYRGMFVLSLEDGWIKFAVDDPRIAEMLCQIREELIKLLEEKIEDPSINLHTHDHGKKVINTIVHVIT